MKVTVLRGMTPWRYKYTDVSSLSLFLGCYAACICLLPTFQDSTSI